MSNPENVEGERPVDPNAPPVEETDEQRRYRHSVDPDYGVEEKPARPGHDLPSGAHPDHDLPSGPAKPDHDLPSGGARPGHDLPSAPARPKK